jgi:hypothetical protein
MQDIAPCRIPQTRRIGQTANNQTHGEVLAEQPDFSLAAGAKGLG